MPCPSGFEPRPKVFQEGTCQKVLWSGGGHKVMEIFDPRANNSHYPAVQLKGGHVDYPIRYDDGTIVYDSPGRIPQYVKDKVEELL